MSPVIFLWGIAEEEKLKNEKSCKSANKKSFLFAYMGVEHLL